MPGLLAVEDGEQETDAKWSQKIIEAMEKASSLGRRRRVFFCDYNNLVVLGCERRVCEGSKRAELGRCWRRDASENLHRREAYQKAVGNMLFVVVVQ